MGSCKHWIQYRSVFVSNVYSCPFLVVLSVFNVCVVYFDCLNTQNEDKQNTQHKHRKLTGQPGMVYCIQCLQLPIPGCPVGFLCLCYGFCLSSFCVLYPMFTAAHSWLSCRFSITNIENRRDNQEWPAVNIG
jgi:hypothetical protein